MNRRFSITGVAVVTVMIGFPLSAAIGLEHGKVMKKQHDTMHTFQKEWPKASEAAKEGRPEEAKKHAEIIQGSAENLGDFMLHKNPERRQEFLKQAREFKSLIMDFRQAAEKGDREKLKKIAPEIDRACNGCHQSFR